MIRRLAILALAASSLAGCNLGLGRSDEVRFVRFFLPAGGRIDAPAATTAAPPPVLLAVRAAGHVDARMCWRRGDVELGYHDDLRWAEAPDRILAKRLDLEIHGARGFPRGGGDDAVVIELDAFEQWLDDPLEARLALTLRRTGGGGVERVHRLTISHPLEDASPEALAASLGAALDEAVAATADWIAVTAGPAHPK
jgi:hypothetical protein